jgi:hypothetical protein
MLPTLPTNTHVQLAREFTPTLQAGNNPDPAGSRFRSTVVRLSDALTSLARRMRTGEPAEAATSDWIRAAGQLSARR